MRMLKAAKEKMCRKSRNSRSTKSLGRNLPKKSGPSGSQPVGYRFKPVHEGAKVGSGGRGWEEEESRK